MFLRLIGILHCILHVCIQLCITKIRIDYGVNFGFLYKKKYENILLEIRSYDHMPSLYSAYKVFISGMKLYSMSTFGGV